MNGPKSHTVFRERIFPVLFMFVITVVFIGIVSSIYLGTREIVLRNEALYLKRAVLFAADIEIPEGAEAVEARYVDRIREVPRYNEAGDVTGIAFYEVLGSGDRRSGYVLPATGPGLWGEIDAVVGFDENLEAITGVDFTKQNETPGLGGRISELWFREQFRGKKAPLSRVPEGTVGEGVDEFDAITGATITSTAIQNILNRIQKEAPDITAQGR